jgi:hypothetical protein
MLTYCVANNAKLSGRDRDTDQPAFAAAFVHHRRPRRRCCPARCPRGSFSCRPENDNALRPGPRVPRPPCHLHRRHLCRRSQPLTDQAWRHHPEWWRHAPYLPVTGHGWVRGIAPGGERFAWVGSRSVGYDVRRRAVTRVVIPGDNTGSIRRSGRWASRPGS